MYHNWGTHASSFLENTHIVLNRLTIKVKNRWLASQIPETPGPGLSRDTTFTLQTSSYQHVHCSITSDPFFITALCFYHGKNCQQKHQKGGKIQKSPPYLTKAWWFSRHTFEIAREIWKSNRQQLQKICNCYTSSDLKILLLFWSGRHVKSVSEGTGAKEVSMTEGLNSGSGLSWQPRTWSVRNLGRHSPIIYFYCEPIQDNVCSQCSLWFFKVLFPS